ncbi:rRNA biogenesis protein rrp5 [Clostridium sp. YIM B02515]|uniref:rRNA biogenesis protein rrp5 n=1 Tax=Clostridium rhizosphaerae TaxID=2803861 RepID=A0ABS1TFC4_9CLOT|nr:rRNA biogenesis protein rrp5 [Clostridium rhizosphaerae]MBL4937782.1 rRNA biogenesis protein rrp5 [Clostridium rhizosphaerae]
MSKIKLLLDLVSDMRSLADSLQAVCEAMAEGEPAAEDTKPASIEESEPKKTAKSANKKVKLEDVRAVLAEKSQAGMTAKVREIIEKYGATKLSEIDPKHYAEVLKAAEGLVNE